MPFWIASSKLVADDEVISETFATAMGTSSARAKGACLLA
jgi:hypothetical protein